MEIGGVEVDLTGSLFGGLCELAAARLAKAGPVSLSRLYVHRLRRALEQAAGRAGNEYSLIHSVAKGKYVLAVSPKRIFVAESFREVFSQTASARRAQRCCWNTLVEEWASLPPLPPGRGLG